jgi:methylthioribose-1-phosphate isomerase
VVKTIEWKDNFVRILDQVRLPLEEVYLDCFSYRDVMCAISKMNIRGAPAIGLATALGIALGVQGICDEDRELFCREMDGICEEFFRTRPTAVNLVWAINQLKETASNHSGSVADLKEAIKARALTILEEDLYINREIGRQGEPLIPAGARILTHCNAGALATAGYGTALGVIRAAHEAGKKISVYVDETRPFLQGARLTAWELIQEKIPSILITDNMAGYFMQQGKIDLVIVGADRVAANGDVANKIGTYSLGVLARAHAIPFYVAAPTSTLDLNLSTGREIPIEERNHEEVTCIRGIRIAPEKIDVANPAFDVTPGEYISALITEKGVVYPPYAEGLRIVAGGAEEAGEARKKAGVSIFGGQKSRRWLNGPF